MAIIEQHRVRNPRRGLPFGVMLVDGRVVENPKESSAIRLAVDLFGEGKSVAEAAVELNRRGFTTRLGGAWSAVKIVHATPKFRRAVAEFGLDPLPPHVAKRGRPLKAKSKSKSKSKSKPKSKPIPRVTFEIREPDNAELREYDETWQDRVVAEKRAVEARRRAEDKRIAAEKVRRAKATAARKKAEEEAAAARKREAMKQVLPCDRFSKAWEMVAEGYCAKYFARNARGKECWPENEEAVAWSLSGALYVIYADVPEYERACGKVGDAIEEATGEREAIDDWSDRVGQKEVVGLLKELDL